jgi:hypothetical protein
MHFLHVHHDIFWESSTDDVFGDLADYATIVVPVSTTKAGSFSNDTVMPLTEIERSPVSDNVVDDNFSKSTLVSSMLMIIVEGIFC